jgi:hypothetical protein
VVVRSGEGADLFPCHPMPFLSTSMASEERQVEPWRETTEKPARSTLSGCQRRALQSGVVAKGRTILRRQRGSMHRSQEGDQFSDGFSA